MAGLRVPCQTWELLRHLLRKRREGDPGDHTADTKDWASELGLGGTGGLGQLLLAVRWWDLEVTGRDSSKSVSSSSQKSH